jgi:hypothetical protein
MPSTSAVCAASSKTHRQPTCTRTSTSACTPSCSPPSYSTCPGPAHRCITQRATQAQRAWVQFWGMHNRFCMVHLPRVFKQEDLHSQFLLASELFSPNGRGGTAVTLQSQFQNPLGRTPADNHHCTCTAAAWTSLPYSDLTFSQKTNF